MMVDNVTTNAVDDSVRYTVAVELRLALVAQLLF